jgi:hypothetical protein
MRRLIGTKTEDVRGDWRRLHNGERHVIESRMMWQVKYTATVILWKNLKETDHLKDPTTEGRKF